MEPCMFELAVSPVGGVGEPCVRAIEGWVVKNASYYHVVLEGRGRERRLRALVLFAEPKRSRNMRQNIWYRFVKPHHKESVGRFTVFTEAVPSGSWKMHTVAARGPLELLCRKLPVDARTEVSDGLVQEEINPPPRHAVPAPVPRCKAMTLDVLDSVCKEVFQELGAGHTERVYHRGIISVLNHKGIFHRSEVSVPIYVRGDCVGNGRADLVVGNLAVELKALSNPPPKVSGQLAKYVKSLNKDVADAFNRRAVRSSFFAGTGAAEDGFIVDDDFEQEQALLCEKLFRGVTVNFNQRTERVDMTLLQAQDAESLVRAPAPPARWTSVERTHSSEGAGDARRWLQENVQRFVRLYGLRDRIMGHSPQPLNSLVKEFEAFVGAEIQSLQDFREALEGCAAQAGAPRTNKRSAQACAPRDVKRNRLPLPPCLDTLDLS